jgi:hypothetical protein
MTVPMMKDMEKRWLALNYSKPRKYSCFGDYDVDGTTAVSLVSSYLKPIILMLPPIFQIATMIWDFVKGIDFAMTMACP